ncbi:MAG: PEP-CTERM sorting domain-containing protein [Gemmatimonadaceae bacterium]
MKLRAPLVSLALSAAFSAGLAAQTVVVTPSNPQGWSGATYGPTFTSPGVGASVGITSTYPRSGSGSVEMGLATAQDNEADWSMSFSNGGYSLASVTTLAYDWLRSSSSTTNGIIMPAFALGLNDGRYLVYERAYNQAGNAPADAWVTSDILNGNFWFTGNGTGVCGSYGAFQTLSYFNANCYEDTAVVTSLTAFIGYTQAGSFYGAVDNVSFGVDEGTPTTWNFEPDASSVVPEPASIVLFGAGLAGVAAVRRKRRQA